MGFAMIVVRTVWRFICNTRPAVAPFIALFLFVAAPGVFAAEKSDAKENVDWRSPDGKFAFRTFYGEDRRSIDLIDSKSGKKLQRIDETDMAQTDWDVLWAPDSKRFALMTRVGHPVQGVDVFFQRGDAFQKIELADNLPKAEIPEKLREGKDFPHVAAANWETAEQWKMDGALVVSIATWIDGAGTTLKATRTVVVRFNRAGKAKVVKSTIRYETEND